MEYFVGNVLKEARRELSKITEDALFVDGQFKYSKNFFIEWVKIRINDFNKNFLGICCGQTGSGKSWSMIRFCEMIDPNFNINNIVFSSSEFMDLLNSGILKKGSCILFEEGQVSMDRRSWYSISNKMINYILSTFRHLNLSVIFTTPELTYIDSNSVKLFHCYLETEHIDFNNDTSTIRPKLIQTDHRTGKTYYKYLRVFMDNRIHILDRLILKKANKQLLAQYEIKKKQFTENLNRRISLEIKKIEEIQGIKNEKIKVLTEQEEYIYKLHSSGYSISQISQVTGKRPDQLYAILSKVRNKGIEIVG